MPMISPLSGSVIHGSFLEISFVMIIFGVLIKPIGMDPSSSQRRPLPRI
jgi:hypothetical protein